MNKSYSLEIDLIVLASHRPDLSDYFVGLNAVRIERLANCSVLVARAKAIRARHAK